MAKRDYTPEEIKKVLIAKGDDTVEGVYEALKEEWEMYREMVERHG